MHVSGLEQERLVLLPADQTILERPFLQFIPFGEDEHGDKISDVSGLLIRDNVEYLHECAQRVQGDEAAETIVERLCDLLNQRIRDSAHHVTPAFLGNVWNSYSYEFASFLREMCKVLSGDPQYHFNVGKEKHISPLIQTLGRPFPLSQIHKMYPYFAHKYARALHCTTIQATKNSAILRLEFPDHVLKQFGPYRKACAAQTCESSKSRIAMVPVRVHGRTASTVKDRACIVKGDPFCEWEVSWAPERRALVYWPMWSLVSGALVFTSLALTSSPIPILSAATAALIASATAFIGGYMLQREAKEREAVIQEQVAFVEARHEELRDAYLEQQRTHVELQRNVNRLTALHQSCLLFSATLDRDALIQTVLDSVIRDLHYDRVMMSFYDRTRNALHGNFIAGVPPDLSAYVRAYEVGSIRADSLIGRAIVGREPILVKDVKRVSAELDPLNQELAQRTGARSLIIVPLTSKDLVLGVLVADRTKEECLTEGDLDVLATLAAQVAIALDNTEAYRQVEELNTRLEAKVRERTEELERADKLRSLFLSHVSHELRTPLTSIMGFMDNLLHGVVGPLSEKQDVYLRRMKANAERLIRMIEDLLDRTRIEAGRLEISPARVNLETVVFDVVEQLEAFAKEKDQQLNVTPSGESLLVWADPDRLVQIVTNLVQNAIKYTQERGSIAVTVGRSNERYARVAVSDNGPGIPQDALEKIFDPFFRVSQPSKTRPKGLGLGLSIVKRLVQMHGGTIEVRSELEKGSEFCLTLPLDRPAPDAQSVSSRDPKRILIVDDDPDIRQLLQDRLSNDGYLAETAVNPVLALQRLRAQTYDGLILDIALPQMEGLEVLRLLRQEQNHIPIIMVTASCAKQRAIEALTLGAQAFILKPFDLEELQHTIHVYFGGPSQRADTFSRARH